MPLDPSIPLQVKPLVLPDRLSDLGKMMQIKHMQDQQRLADLQSQLLPLKLQDLKEKIEKSKKQEEFVRALFANRRTGPGESALAQGAAHGDVRPTVTNAARMSPQSGFREFSPEELMAARVLGLDPDELIKINQWAQPKLENVPGVGMVHPRTAETVRSIPRVGESGRAVGLAQTPDGRWTTYVPEGSVAAYGGFQRADEEAKARYTPFLGEVDKDNRPIPQTVYEFANGRQPQQPSQAPLQAPAPPTPPVTPSAAPAASGQTQFDEIFVSAAQKYGVDAEDLRRLAITESSLNPAAVNRRDANGGSFGLMQLNGQHLSRFGVPVEAAMDPQTNIFLGAQLWKEALDKARGNKAMAVQIYKGATSDRGRAAVAPAASFITGQQQQAPSERRGMGLSAAEKLTQQELAKRKLEEPKATSSYHETISNMDRMSSVANEILRSPYLASSVGMSPLGLLPHTPQRGVRANFDTLKSQIAISVLQAVRNASQTGGAFGQVSNFEQRMMQDNIAALQTAQTPADVMKALTKIISYTQSAKGRLRDAYKNTYSSEPPPAPAPVNPTKEIDFNNLPSRR